MLLCCDSNNHFTGTKPKSLIQAARRAVVMISFSFFCSSEFLMSLHKSELNAIIVINLRANY